MITRKQATEKPTIVLDQGELTDLVGIYHAWKDYMDCGSTDNLMLEQIFDHYLFVLATILRKAGNVDLIKSPDHKTIKPQRYLM